MTYTANPATRIGHVHLKVSDIDRAIGFYRDVMGFDLVQRYGTQAAFLSAGGYHHHIGLNTWQSRGGQPPAPGTTGLFHVAFLYPDRPALARALNQVIAAGVPIDGAADHGVSEAIYFRDPDGNGIEIYRDRPETTGRATPRARSPWSTIPSTSRRFWPKRNRSVRRRTC
jgi:catechol 2,3-dioxygenase